MSTLKYIVCVSGFDYVSSRNLVYSLYNTCVSAPLDKLDRRGALDSSSEPDGDGGL